MNTHTYEKMSFNGYYEFLLVNMILTYNVIIIIIIQNIDRLNNLTFLKYNLLKSLIY